MLRITDFEKGIGRPVDVTIPFQRRQLAHAIDAGEPAASRCRPVARAVDAIVTELCGGPARPRRLLPRLFS
jgi:hypothetical protein